jgi:hypothetical protein
MKTALAKRERFLARLFDDDASHCSSPGVPGKGSPER